ncbi:MAG: hypothetical protein H6779_02320 [Candidatus Nomurabacteria bacterium]|nr:MAG: hypothetical protein H6779_02320 [Candidatus Nomurabacteria bacterium]
MEINEFFLEERRDIYCDKCGDWMILDYDVFDETVTGVHFHLENFPYLVCPSCGFRCLPEHGSACVIHLHQRATKAGLAEFTQARNKIQEEFKFTDIDFLYDPDDYFLLPGLERPHDVGFLTPVFFNKEALIKFQNNPNYRVRLASKTYGTIYGSDEFYISFGINRNGKLIMWLGDVASLPRNEQYYLRSENVESDHDIGSEFYDGQIEVKFTEHSPEDALLNARAEFLEAATKEFGLEFENLKEETLVSIEELNTPVFHSVKEMKDVIDLLNKIVIESLHATNLKRSIVTLGGDPADLGTLKKLEMCFSLRYPEKDIHSTVSSLFVLYDLRVSLLHAQSKNDYEEILKTVCERLGIAEGSDFSLIYSTLIQQLTDTFNDLAQK